MPAIGLHGLLGTKIKLNMTLPALLTQRGTGAEPCIVLPQPPARADFRTVNSVEVVTRIRSGLRYARNGRLVGFYDIATIAPKQFVTQRPVLTGQRTPLMCVNNYCID